MHKLIITVLTCLIISACATSPGPGSGEGAKAVNSAGLRQAITLYRQGNMAQAARATEAVLTTEPSNAQAYNLQGLIAQRLNRPEVALKNFRRASQLAPQDASILNNYGTFLCSTRRYDDALKLFSLASQISNNSKPDVAYTNAGLCAKRAGKPNQAKKQFSQAVRINASQPIALYEMASLHFDEGKYTDAQAWFEQYSASNAYNARSLLLGARIAHGLGNSAAMEDHIAKLESGYPGSKEALQARSLRNQLTRQAAAPSVSQQQGLSRVMLWNPAHFTVQIASDKNRSVISQISQSAGIPQPAVIVPISHNGQVWYTLVAGDFSEFSQARIAMGRLSNSVKQKKPWVRSVRDIQEAIQ